MAGKPNVVQVTGSLFLAALVLPFAADLASAVSAQPCPGGPNCYPWGAEGPVAGIWSYESKANYLFRGFSQLALLICIGLYLIVRAGTEEGVPRGARPYLLGGSAAWLLLWLV